MVTVEDAEWNDFESEEVDYSGLKIQNLQIASKEEEEVNEEREGNSDTDEDGEKREKGQDGPWNKATGEGALQQEMAHEAPPTRKEEAPAPAPVKSGKYVPPSMRGRTDNPEPLRRVPKSRKVAPDLRNQDEFPSLGANPLPQEIDTHEILPYFDGFPYFLKKKNRFGRKYAFNLTQAVLVVSCIVVESNATFSVARSDWWFSTN
ncbi:hypothetical protein CAPTEDRAFT_203128, partial [Capitella teleta]